MKHHFPELHMIHVHHTHHMHHHNPGEGHWITDHSRMVAFVLACLVASTLVAVMASIKFYISTGIWPLFG